jgi:type IV pilus assembly protein PilB
MSMGIKPHLVANAVLLICAPRVVRRICRDCQAPEEVDPRMLIDAGYTPEEAKTVKPYKGAGCSTCGNTGYKGRVGLYETLEMTGELREVTLLDAPPELRKKAVEQGMISLRRSGLNKVATGITTLNQVLLETPY